MRRWEHFRERVDAFRRDPIRFTAHMRSPRAAFSCKLFLARRVHDLYFNPQIEEFAPRHGVCPMRFTSAFKELDPIPQFKATAKLASFLEGATAGLN